MKELNTIQTKLVAPKNQKNGFGNYNYRNLEGIMEAVKPLLIETECTITFNDELIMLGDRIFCKSTATLKNQQGDIETSTSFAELDNHKGMSKEQSTGSSSSYARKYAICSLLAIDDNADPDMLDNRETASAPAPTAPTQDNAAVLKSFCASMKTQPGVDIKDLTDWYTYWSKRIESGDFKGDINPVKLWASHTNRNKS